jgi:hypothetical protein
MGENIKLLLENTISSFHQLPYLFAGTGLSIRYSHAPSWNELLYDIWKIVNPNKVERDFKKLKQKIELDVNARYTDLSENEKKYYVNPILASNIEKDFCSLYYSYDGFDTTIFSDNENDDIITNEINPFKYYVSKELKEIVIEPSSVNYNELQYLVQNQNKFAGVITTNYDSLLENIFKDFSVLIGQDSLLAANTLSIFEIFKIHGCSSCPNSIIINEKDYENFDKNSNTYQLNF